ncbi:MAG TPA: WecB/TagA/CpsF family glycosyltransferase [Candidatus Sumerlaeota bacterium]|nr:WecB/TagA/CpsF family glycosyltransferase [Candidatus Sumerlaeota bacterium]HOR26677.1 WecB/TagA/CpsF family glycosyltransferase [Candidatus Sumerlaeota bacterium]HPK03127.1 WecB/TagA/CpsF family glycosyltransferase [Candidatus Sumerlaeota bacterium]
MDAQFANAAASASAAAAIRWQRLGNVPLSTVTLNEAVEWIARWAGQAPFRLVVTPNVDHLVTLQRDAAFGAAYARADLSLADGQPVVWAARYLGLRGVEKVSGSDLLPALCARGAREGWRAYFVGGRDDEELGLCLRRIGERYPGLRVGGTSPPFGFEADARQTDALLGRILEFGPDLLLLGVGSPKSEIWLARHAERLGQGVGLSIGAGMRFVAGLEPRAPRWMQRAGLEWSFRLMREPGRLWRRYLVEDVRFLPLVLRWKREARRRKLN